MLMFARVVLSADLILNGEWNVAKLRRAVPQDIVEKIIQVQPHSESDKANWNLNITGLCTL